MRKTKAFNACGYSILARERVSRAVEHTILFDADVEVPAGARERIERTIRAALEAERVALPCEIDVLLTDGAGIREINRETRQVDAPTDVLSFPMFELEPGTPPKGDSFLDPETGLCPLGDICINLDRARAQGEEFGHGLERELCYLTVHSALHLLGYDHLDEGPMKAQMRAREEEILGAMGVARGE